MFRLGKLALLAGLLLVASIAVAQGRAWAVFLDRGAVTGVVFIDLSTGVQNRVDIEGERFTIVNGAVLLFDARNRTVELVGPDGRRRPHPFIILTPEETRVEWVVSADGKRIAWTTIAGAAPGLITTVTRVADVDGADARAVFQETRTDGLRAKPVAFSPDDVQLYMDYQPDGLDVLTIFPQFAGLFALDVTAQDPASTFAFLPDEPGDFTGAGFGGGYFLRLSVGNQMGGFDLRAQQFATGRIIDIPASYSGSYSIAGDVLISPDGLHAVYAQTALQGVSAGAAQSETVLMYVNLSDFTQSPLTSPQQGILRPVAWSEDDAAVILTNPNRTGTWKARLADGRVQQVAELTYLGLLTGER